MPTLLLSQRHSSDSNVMWRAAVHAGWDVERIRGYTIDPALAGRDPVLYGETLLADALTAPLELAFLEPTADWLPSLPIATASALFGSPRSPTPAPSRSLHS